MNSEVVKYLGKLGNVAELVGSITDSAACAELGGQLFTLKEVSDGRLSACEIKVVLEIPGADNYAAIFNVLHKNGLLFGTNGQIVLKHNRLCVHMKDIVGIFFENDKQPVKQVGQTVAEKLQGSIPLSVPVGMGNNAKNFLHF